MEQSARFDAEEGRVEIRKIMIVDDEPDIRVVAEMSLSVVGGWQVSAHSSGEQALSGAARETPDIILLDMMMPGMDGLTTLVRLKENQETCQIPVVLMTAKAQAHEIEQYLQAGACAVIPKPFDPMGLPAKLRAIARSLP